MDDLSVIQRLGTHRFIGDLANILTQVADEVAQTRRKGKVTVTFDLSPAQGSDLGVVVAESIKRSPPVRDANGAIYFVYAGELWDADPRQPQLEFRVASDTTEVRTPEDPGGTVREA